MTEITRAEIRPTTNADIPGLKTVLDETGLFPSDMLAEMLAGFLAENPEGEMWLSAHLGGRPEGLCYAAPEPFTDGTWNMRALGVRPSQQRSGIGRALVNDLEYRLRAGGARVLVVDTSGTQDFAPARAFYKGCGYAEAARLADFWTEGDDKVTFWKRISTG